MKLSRAEIVTGLVERHGYPQAGAAMVVTRLLNLEPPLQDDFERWWREGTIPTTEIEGFTVTRLAREQGLKPIAAFLTLDWLIREPAKAKAAVLQGHDRITPT